jgi:DNA adenine methylase
LSTAASATVVPLDYLREAAGRPLSTTPRPFLRWAGSKRGLLSQIIDVLPTSYRTYHEPFLGSGALFFLLKPERALLSDSCDELIQTFSALKTNASAVARYLRPLRPSKTTYYNIRSNRSTGPYRRAAEFIYLNKTCWNGLYRVNAQGEFNVPYGAPKTDAIFDEDNLVSCARALDRPGVRVTTRTFRQALTYVRRGDLVFLDPPYVTGHNNNGFIDYNENLFSWQDQVDLAAVAVKLARGGVHVVVTNAFHDPLTDLYTGFHCRPLHRRSTLASAADRRGPVTEALLWSTSRG